MRVKIMNKSTIAKKKVRSNEEMTVRIEENVIGPLVVWQLFVGQAWIATFPTYKEALKKGREIINHA